jgi:acyl carrier protein
MDAGHSAAEILTYLREELAVLDPDALVAGMTAESELASLGLDSMTMVAAVAALEARYTIHLGDNELVGVETVAQLISLVRSATTTEAGDRDEVRRESPVCRSCGVPL